MYEVLWNQQVSRVLDYPRRQRTYRQLAEEVARLKALPKEQHERSARYGALTNIVTSQPPQYDMAASTSAEPDQDTQGHEVVDFVVGIDDARDDLNELLKEEATVERRQLKVVAIVGFPGSGKTVLATAMYRSQAVGDGGRFDLKAWVWAGNRDSREVLAEKLGNLGVQILRTSVTSLKEQLKQHLERKKSFAMRTRSKVASHEFEEDSTSSDSEDQTQDGSESNLRSFDSIDNDMLVTIFKNVVCKSLRAAGPSTSNSNDNVLISTFKDAACVAFRDEMSSLGCYTSNPKKHDDPATKDLSYKTPRSRFNVSYFYEVINSLDDRKKKVIKDYGFGCLLLFEKCAVPLSFASWIAQHVDPSKAQILIKDKAITLSRESVHAVLDLPINGTPIERDKSISKPAFLKLIKSSTLPNFYYFGKKLLEPNLEDDDIVRSFLAVALSTFLCPTASVNISPDYLSPLIVVKEAKNWDWSKLVCDWLLRLLKKYQRQIKSRHHSTASLGGCLYYLSVLYLDHLDFPQKDAPASNIPRINIWRGDMIKRFSDVDRIDSNNFGKMNVKDTSNTCYLNHLSAYPSSGGVPSNDAHDDMHNTPGLDHRCFRLLLDTYADSFSPQVLNELEQIYAKHAAYFPNSVHHNLQLGFLDIIKYFFDSARKEKSFDSSQKGGGTASAAKYAENAAAGQDGEDGSRRPASVSAAAGQDGEDGSCRPASVSAAAGQDGEDVGVDKNRFFDDVFEESPPRQCDRSNCGTEILSSSGNDSESRIPTQDTVVLPSNGGSGNDVQGTSQSKRNRVGTSSIDTGRIKKSKTRLSGTFDSESPISGQSIGVRTRSRQAPDFVVDSLETILKRNRKKRGGARKNSNINTSENEVEIIDVDGDDGLQKDDTCGVHIHDKQGEVSSAPLNMPNLSGNLSVPDKANTIRKNWKRVVVRRRVTTAASDVESENNKNPEKCSSQFEAADVMNTPNLGATKSSLGKQEMEGGNSVPSGAAGKSASFNYMLRTDDSNKRPIYFDFEAPSFSLGIGSDHDEQFDCDASRGSAGAPHFDSTPMVSRFCTSPSFDQSVQFGDADVESSPIVTPIAMINPSGEYVSLSPQEDAQPIESNFERCRKLNFEFESTSSGKMSKCRARRLNRPNSYLHDFETGQSVVRFNVNFRVRMFYERAINYGQDSSYQNRIAINYSGVLVTFSVLAESMRRDYKGGFVQNYVMNAFCRKLSLDDHPRRSKKHYFFSTVGDHLIGNTSSVHDSSVEKSFGYANNSYALKSSHMLFFPICHSNHWFVFVVDIRDKFFVFLDCFFNEDSDYQRNVRSIIIPKFLSMWDRYIGVQCDFENFAVHYPTVPMLKVGDNDFFRRADDGIFTMKFLELWDPYTNLMNKFSCRNMGDIRANYVYDMVMSNHNNVSFAKKLFSDES